MNANDRGSWERKRGGGGDTLQHTLPRKTVQDEEEEEKSSLEDKDVDSYPLRPGFSTLVGERTRSR